MRDQLNAGATSETAQTWKTIHTRHTHSFIPTRRIWWNDYYGSQMIFGDRVGLKFPDICLIGEQKKKTRKNLTQETCLDQGSNPGPLRDRRACYRLFHNGGPNYGIWTVKFNVIPTFHQSLISINIVLSFEINFVLLNFNLVKKFCNSLKIYKFIDCEAIIQRKRAHFKISQIFSHENYVWSPHEHFFNLIICFHKHRSMSRLSSNFTKKRKT